MEQEYNNLIELHGQTEMKIIFGSLEGYTRVREVCAYSDLSSDLHNLIDSVEYISKIINK